MSKVLLNDMEQIVSDESFLREELRGSTVLITGATGAIGSAIVRTLLAANEKYGLNVRILAFCRNQKKAKQLFGPCGAEFYEQEICTPLSVPGRVEYIFHCAAVTKSSEMAANPVGVIETSFKGTENILALAREKSVKSMVYLSSMEVYGITDPALPWVKEENLGYIDLQKIRSCYPESKRMCECLCACWYFQYGVPVKTARLAQTFGAGTSKEDSRVFAQFARSATAGEDIILHTEGNSLGNYCYLADTVRGLFLLLLKGENGNAYNIVNPDASMTIREMAELVANKVCNEKITVRIEKPADIEKLGYPPDTAMRLSAEKIEKLGWRPRYGLKDMYQRMIQDWRENTLV